MGIICERCGRDIDALGQDNMGMCWPLCEDCWNERRFRESLDAKAEEEAAHPGVEIGPALGVAALRKSIETVYKADWARTMALTKLNECEMWLGRCEPRETAAPTLKGAASPADAPCLKDDEARGFAMPDVTAEKLAKSLREAMQQAMRMAVE